MAQTADDFLRGIPPARQQPQTADEFLSGLDAGGSTPTAEDTGWNRLALTNPFEPAPTAPGFRPRDEPDENSAFSYQPPTDGDSFPVPNVAPYTQPMGPIGGHPSPATGMYTQPEAKPPSMAESFSLMERIGIAGMAGLNRYSPLGKLAMESQAYGELENSGYGEDADSGFHFSVGGLTSMGEIRLDPVTAAKNRLHERRRDAAEKIADSRLGQMNQAVTERGGVLDKLSRQAGEYGIIAPAAVGMAKPLTSLLAPLAGATAAPVLGGALGFGAAEAAIPAISEGLGGPEAEGTALDRGLNAVAMGGAGLALSKLVKGISPLLIPAKGTGGSFARGALEQAGLGGGMALPSGDPEEIIAGTILGGAVPHRSDARPAPKQPKIPKWAEPHPKAPPVEQQSFEGRKRAAMMGKPEKTVSTANEREFTGLSEKAQSAGAVETNTSRGPVQYWPDLAGEQIKKSHPELADMPVDEAIRTLADKDSLGEVLGYGEGNSSKGYADTLTGYDESGKQGITIAANNPASAKAALKDMGYRDIKSQTPADVIGERLSGEQPAKMAAQNDTRGKGEFFHGTSADIKSLEEGYYSGRNIYGEGFYATDDTQTAGSYTKKNARGKEGAPENIYKITEKEPVKFYDLDKRIDPQVWTILEGQTKHLESLDVAMKDAGYSATLADVLNETRRSSSEYRESSDTVTETFEAIKDKLRDLGYGGFTHKGGNIAGKGQREHQVKIYWNPETQIAHELVAPTKPARMAAQPKDTRPKVIADPDAVAESIPMKIGEAPKKGGTKYEVIRGLEKISEKISTLGADGRPSTGRGVPHMDKGTLGWFAPKSEQLSLKTGGDVTTHAHEIGHQLHGVLFNTRSFSDADPFFQKHESILRKFDYDQDPTTGQRPHEGLAEWSKAFLTHPDTVRKIDPALFDDYWKEINRYDASALGRKKLAPLIKEAQDNYKAWLESDRAMGQIFYPEQRKRTEGMARDAKNFLHRMYQETVHEQSILDRITNVYEKQTGKRTPDELNPASLVTVSRAAGARTGNRFLYEGRVNGKTLELDKSSKPLTKVLEPIKDQHREFEGYWNTKRAEWLIGYKAKADARLAAEKATLDDLKQSKASRSAISDQKKAIDLAEVEVAEAERMGGAGREYLKSIGLKEADLAANLAEREKRGPQFKGVLDDIRKYNDGLMQYGVDLGLITAEHKRMLQDRHQIYAPWNRQLTKEAQGGAGSGSSVVNVPKSPTERKLFGKNRNPINSPLATLVHQSYAIPRLAERAEVGQRLIEMLTKLDGHTALIERLEKPNQAIKVTMDEMNRHLSKQGVEVTGLSDDALTVFRPDAMFGMFDDGIIRVRNAKTGKPEYFRVKDEALLKAITDYDVPVSDTIGGVAGALLKFGATMKRGLIVANPAFGLANIARDQFSRAYNTGRVNPFKEMRAALDVLHGDLTHNNKWYEEYVGSGAAMGSLQNLIFDKTFKKTQSVLKGNRHDSAWQRALELVRITENLSEAPGRLETYKNVRKNPLPGESTKSNTIRAAVETRESKVDFSRRPASKAMKWWGASTAFLRPAINGMDKTTRVTLGNPKRSAALLGSLMAGTYAAYLWNRSGENKERWAGRFTDNDRNNYWTTMGFSEEDFVDEAKRRGLPMNDKLKLDKGMDDWVADRTWKVPKPFELGLPSTIFERVVLDSVFEDRDVRESATKSFEASIDVIVPPVIPDTVDMVMTALGHTLPSWGTYRGTGKKSMKRERIDPWLDYTDDTPMVFRDIAERFKSSGISPADLDATFNVGIARGFNQLVDLALEEPDLVAKNGMEAIPFLSDIANRFKGRIPSSSSAPLSRLYNLNKQATRVRDTVREMQKRGDNEKLQAYVKDNQELLGIYGILNPSGDQKEDGRSDPMSRLADIRAGVSALRSSKGLDMSPEKRKETIDDLVVTSIFMAEQTLKAIDAAREAGKLTKDEDGADDE